MAFGLTKDERGEKSALVNKLTSAGSEVRAALDAYNGVVAAAFAALGAVVTEYNVVRGEARAFADRVAERLQEDFDDRSEAWQDGANGFAARDMISAWGNPNYLKFLGIAVPVEPDCNIDEDGTSDASQELDDLPE